MTVETSFAIVLAIRMIVTALFVIGATVGAERAGPLVGGLIATLPLGAGPVYVFLAMDHDTQFIADSAVTTLAINVANVAFAVVYALLAQRRSLGLSVSVGLMVWLAIALAINAISWSWAGAALFNLVALPVALWLVRPLRLTAVPRTPSRWYEMLLRAVLAALLVGVTVTLSFRIGPASSGILAVLPIILLSIMVIMHPRVGGRPTAAVLSNGVLGLVGFAFAATALHFAVRPFGSAVALSLALSISVGWGLLVFAARRRGVAV
ncbi:MAG: hypothetical protein AB7T86_00855 [Xanthobacteraceae bacterium]|uniref:hypothetical protein n=1 Tax=Pseudolabrys sp. TaxID=1960880 RepID=UPI003D12F579